MPSYLEVKREGPALPRRRLVAPTVRIYYNCLHAQPLQISNGHV